MIILCNKCGKKCYVSPSKVERKIIDPRDFYCQQCNKHLHKIVRKHDTRMIRKLIRLARFKEKRLDG